MSFKKIIKFIVRLQGLSDVQKKSILVAVLIISGLALGFWWIVSTANIISKTGKDAKMVNLPQMDAKDMEALNALKNLGGQAKDRLANVSVDSLVPKETSLDTSEDTADWQVYANSKYSFEVKHPADWFTGGAVRTDGFEDIYISPESPKNNFAFIGEALNINISKARVGKSLLDEIKERYGVMDVDFIKESVAVGAVDGFIIETICEGVGCGVKEQVFIKNGYFYILIARGLQSEKILPTFKFTK